MSRNITLRMDEEILKKCRHAAVEDDLSLSQWVAGQLERIIRHRNAYKKARIRAMKRLEKGIHLGGSPMKRETIYER